MPVVAEAATRPAGRVRRGCGYRIVAGRYVETKVEGIFLRGPDGSPETFARCLYDPSIAVFSARVGVTEIGVHLVDYPTKDGGSVTHVLDIVGATYYPDV